MTFQIRTKDGEILTVHVETGNGLSKIVVNSEHCSIPFDPDDINELLHEVEDGE